MCETFLAADQLTSPKTPSPKAICRIVFPIPCSFWVLVAGWFRLCSSGRDMGRGLASRIAVRDAHRCGVLESASSLGGLSDLGIMCCWFLIMDPPCSTTPKIQFLTGKKIR